MAFAVSAPRRAAALGTLMLLYVFNFDRQTIATLVEPIKADLGLADWQFGVVSGVAFAALYATLGIPVARLADRSHRANIMSVAVALWSAMTAACAGVGSLRLALLVVLLALAWCALHYSLAGRTLRAETLAPPTRRTSA